MALHFFRVSPKCRTGGTVVNDRHIWPPAHEREGRGLAFPAQSAMMASAVAQSSHKHGTTAWDAHASPP